MPRRKIIRKKLKEPDEFVSFSEQAIHFVSHYLKKIIAGIIVVVVIILIGVFFQRWEKKKEANADQKLSQAVELYQRVSSPYREGSPAEYKSVMQKFDEVSSTFPGTTSGKLALLYGADMHLRLAEFGEAVKEYQTFLQKVGSNKLYRYLALEGMGYAYEGMKDYEKAAQAYQKILEKGEGVHLADAYLNVGRCYEKLGKNKEAVENYKAYLKVADKSSMANAVLRKVSLLEK